MVRTARLAFDDEHHHSHDFPQLVDSEIEDASFDSLLIPSGDADTFQGQLSGQGSAFVSGDDTPPQPSQPEKRPRNQRAA